VVGSLFIAWNRRHKGFDADDRYRTGDGFYPQTVCALSTAGKDAIALMGYRGLGNAMLSESLQHCRWVSAGNRQIAVRSGTSRSLQR